MHHPSAAEIALGSEAVRAHLSSCQACRQLALMLNGAAPEPPAVLGQHRVDRDHYVNWRELADGGGGMGRTFVARDRRLGREVVIKQPLRAPDALGMNLHARFEREALLTARLQHPSIVTVYEAGRFADGEPFYAMPLIRGAPLSEKIARARSLEDRLGLLSHVTAVCEAVGYAHDQGIVHRDIKPANILVGTFGETVLIDWGLAKDLRAADEKPAPSTPPDGADGLTQLGVGTPQYMPPEQALGAAPDVRMDVYALGSTLYHALSGRPPYGAIDMATARRNLLRGPPPSLAEVAPDVPPALSDIVARAMARAPADRFHSARALADELRRFQTGQLVQSRRYTVAEILRHFGRRHRAPLAVAAAATVLLGAVGIASLVRIARAQRAASVAEADAQRNRRASMIELWRGLGVTASRLAPDPTRRLEALELGVRAVGSALASGEAPVDEAVQGLYDAESAGPGAVVLEELPAALDEMAFSPEGTYLAAASPDDFSVHVWDARTGRRVRTLAAGGPHFSLRAIRFSPRGDRVLTWGNQPPQAQLWPIGDGAALTLDTHGAFADAEFLKDGTLAFCGEGLTLIDARGQELKRVPLGSACTAFDAAEDRLAVATVAGEVIAFSAAGEMVRSFHAGRVWGVAFAPDGARLAAAGDRGIAILSLGPEAGTPIRHYSVDLPEPGAGANVAFDASGRFVIASADRYQPPVVVDLASDGRAYTAGAAGLIRAGPNGMWASSPGRIESIDLETLSPLRVLQGPGGMSVRAIALSRERIAVATENAAWIVDSSERGAGVRVCHSSEVIGLVETGGLLASAGLDGRVCFWDAQAGTKHSELRVGAEVMALAGSERRLVVAALDGRVLEIDPTAGPTPTMRPIAEAGQPVSALAVSPDGDRVAVGRYGGELLLLHLGASPVRLSAPGEPPVVAAAFHPDGALMATGHSTGIIRLWDVASGRRLGEIHLASANNQWDGRSLFTLAFAGRALLAGRFGEETAILDIPSLAEQKRLSGHLIAASRGGDMAVAARAGEFFVHELARSDGARRVHAQRPTTAAAFSPEGSRLAVGDADGIVRLLDLARTETGAAIAIPASGAGTVTALRFSPDGRTLFAGHASGTLRLHPVSSREALGRACSILAQFGRKPEEGCPSMRQPTVARH